MNLPSSLFDATTTLSAMTRGQRGIVNEVAGTGPGFVARLAARGIVPGADVRVVRGGDPLLVAIDDTRWALSRADADRVAVDVHRVVSTASLPRRLLGWLIP